MKPLDLETFFSSIRITPFVGPTVIFLRTKAGMTQKQLAAATGLNLSGVKRLECGRKRGGWVDSVERVCRAFGVTLQQFFDLAHVLALQDAVRRLWARGNEGASCLLA